MVSEGLADHFSIELLGVPVPPWCLAFSDADNAVWLDAARPLFDSSYTHSTWFFGTSITPPRWTGYTLGYRLVQDYKNRNPGATAAALVSTPANAFRPM
jgi:uncharacterized protein YjaZ